MTIGEAYLCLVGSIWPVYITMRLLMSPERFGWFCEKKCSFFSFFIQKSETFSHSRSSSSAPVVGAKLEMFVLFRPAPLSWIFQAAFLSVMGTRGWRVSRPTTQPLNLLLFAPKTSRPPFLPWEPRGWVLWGNFLSRDKMQSGQEVWQVGGWDILPVSEDNIEKRLRSEIMLFVLCLKVGVAEMSREKDVQCASWKADWQRGHLKHHKQGFFCRYFALVLKTAKAFIPASALINRMKVNFVNSEWCVLPSSEQVLNIFLSYYPKASKELLLKMKTKTILFKLCLQLWLLEL